MAHLIDKDALVAEIEKLIPSEPFPKTSETLYGAEVYGKREICFKILDLIDTLEVKEVDLKDCDAMNGKIDDSDISCNCTSCPVHTTCKYFNPEKESNVKHCFGGVPMQLKQRKESAVKEVDLEKFTEKINTFQARYKHPEITSIKGAMAFMARMFYQYPNVAREWYESMPKATMD